MIFSMRRLLFVVALLICCNLITSCYKFNGYSINPNVKTYYVDQFKISAYNAPATINQTFAEALKDKISRESSLKYSEETPDIEFTGVIQNFDVAAIAPQPGERTAFNRLTISVNVEYTNHQIEKDHWTKTFSHFEDFGAEQNLLQVQDELIEIIFKQILEDVFNGAFNNW